MMKRKNRLNRKNGLGTVMAAAMIGNLGAVSVSNAATLIPIQGTQANTPAGLMFHIQGELEERRVVPLAMKFTVYSSTNASCTGAALYDPHTSLLDSHDPDAIVLKTGHNYYFNTGSIYQVWSMMSNTNNPAAAYDLSVDVFSDDSLETPVFTSLMCVRVECTWSQQSSTGQCTQTSAMPTVTMVTPEPPPPGAS
jgi:hypothetical protein